MFDMCSLRCYHTTLPNHAPLDVDFPRTLLLPLQGAEVPGQRTSKPALLSRAVASLEAGIFCDNNPSVAYPAPQGTAAEAVNTVVNLVTHTTSILGKKSRNRNLRYHRNAPKGGWWHCNTANNRYERFSTTTIPVAKASRESVARGGREYSTQEEWQRW